VQVKKRLLAVTTVHLHNKVARLSQREVEVWDISTYTVFDIVHS